MSPPKSIRTVVHPLHMLTSVNDFKSIYVDLVQTHHKYFEAAGCATAIPLSYRDVMFQKPADGSGPPRAIIVSLDSPTPPTEERYLRILHTPPTHPFLPYEYLITSSRATKPSPFTDFLYRHHLESLFYILVWCAARFTTLPASLTTTIGYYQRRYLLEWTDRRGGLYFKSMMMANDAVFTMFVEDRKSDVLGADKDIQAWLRGLHVIVACPVAEAKYIGMGQYGLDKKVGNTGWVTFDRFLQVLLMGKDRTGAYDRGSTPRCAMTMC